MIHQKTTGEQGLLHNLITIATSRDEFCLMQSKSTKFKNLYYKLMTAYLKEIFYSLLYQRKGQINKKRAQNRFYLSC